MEVFLDIETWSEAPLGSCGAYRYFEHPSTRVTLIGWAVDDAPVNIWQYDEEPDPELANLLADPKVTKWAHNAMFDRAGLKCTPKNWRCSMAYAAALSLPEDLALLCEELGLVEGKLDGDKSLLKLFAIPPGKPDPTHERWCDFRYYLKRDVEVMRAAIRKMQRFPIPESEWELYELDQRINDVGFPVDIEFAERAAELAVDNKELSKAAAVEVTGLDNPNSVSQMRGWLEDQGIDTPDLRAGTVEKLLAGDTPRHVQDALIARQQLATSSLSKYQKMLEMVCGDGTIKGSFHFYGAHTGRWSGRGVQPQNLPRGAISDETAIQTAREAVYEGPEWMAAMYDDVSGTLSSLVRSTIAAPEGYKFVVSDYSAIETVMLAWCCERGRLWKVLTSGRDIYKDYGENLFNVPYDKLTKQHRTQAKPAVLGCGYRLGGKGLQAYAAGFGLVLTSREAYDMVELYRGLYPEVPAFWAALDKAAYTVVTNKSEQLVGQFMFRYERPYLWIDLPSGRSLCYYKPRIENVEKPWGEVGPAVTYQSSRFGRISTHAGKITENIVQAIARDVLAYGLKRASKVLNVVGHVHDEIITLERDSGLALGQATATLEECMTNPPWCGDAPIAVASWEGKFYRKE